MKIAATETAQGRLKTRETKQEFEKKTQGNGRSTPRRESHTASSGSIATRLTKHSDDKKLSPRKKPVLDRSTSESLLNAKAGRVLGIGAEGTPFPRTVKTGTLTTKEKLDMSDAFAARVFREADLDKSGTLTKREIENYFECHPIEQAQILCKEFWDKEGVFTWVLFWDKCAAASASRLPGRSQPRTRASHQLDEITPYMFQHGVEVSG